MGLEQRRDDIRNGYPLPRNLTFCISKCVFLIFGAFSGPCYEHTINRKVSVKNFFYLTHDQLLFLTISDLYNKRVVTRSPMRTCLVHA